MNNIEIMGVLNITENSFHDGGRYNSFKESFQHAKEIIREGADIIDIGGESTRPGSKTVVVKKEIARILPVLKKVKTLKSKPHSLVVKKLGMACSYPGTFNSSIHSIINSTNYKGAVLRTIKAGGCNCSRVNFIGAYFAALKGIDTIPKSWIKKTNLSKKILDQK